MSMIMETVEKEIFLDLEGSKHVFCKPYNLFFLHRRSTEILATACA
jgi:hypothetical protein